MKPHLAFAAAALSLVVCSSALAQTDTPATAETSETATTATNQATPDKFVSAFFKTLQEGNVDAAYNKLLVGSKIAELKDVSTLRSKTKEAIRAFGDVTGYELVSSKNVGTHLIRSTYVSLNKDLPIRWRFYFYKTPDHWKLIDIRVDDRLADLFEESTTIDSQTSTQ